MNDEVPMSRRTRWWRWWPAFTLSGLLIFVMARLIIAAILGADLSSAGVVSPLAILGLILLVSVAAIGGPLVFYTRWSLGGLESVRDAHPGAIVLPVAARPDFVGALEAFATVDGRLPGSAWRVALRTNEFKLLDRSGNALATRSGELRYSLTEFSTIAGHFPCLQVSDDESHSIRLFPLREDSVWFPRQLPADEITAIAERLT